MKTKISLATFLDTPFISLDTCPAWPKRAVHNFDRQQAVAILAALEIKRPLLIRGEPGIGKTQIARAAAQALRMPLATLVVNERTETEDLFWRYDALRRLSDANDPNRGVADEKTYLSAGPLWWALDHVSAAEYKGTHSQEPFMAEGTAFPRDYANGVLLLIDEIDKADRAVPNSLLEALGNYSFEVPYIGGKRVCCTDLDRAPLIIITTNNEQALPPAFVRRCLVLDLVLDEEKEKFVETLAERGKALFGQKFTDPKIFENVATQLYEKRQELKESGETRLPGQAEYLDHLEAILVMKKYELAMKKYKPDWNEDKAIDELAALTYAKFDH